MFNWRQLYNESQAIQPEDTNVSTERICRLVNIYKNDLIEQDLHRYTSRPSRLSRTCQICTPNSYMMYKWLDTSISGNKNLFDFRLSGRSVSTFVYYWKKPLLEGKNKRGQLTDFQEKNDGDLSISNLSIIDENILILKRFSIPIISNILTRFQMYYTYRKARRLSPSIQVHIQPMKTFRYLFQTKICPIFLCFIDEDNNLEQLFWTFRHLITIFNWPRTTKLFSNCSLKSCSTFERWMMDSLGFVDLSSLNRNRLDLLHYLYRCLKTSQENGPIIFLLNHSTIFKPQPSDYVLMSFLCDLVRFDLSIPDLLIIPTCLYQSDLSFSQPFLFKELVESFVRKFQIHKPFNELMTAEERKLLFQCIDCLFRHLGYDTSRLISTRIEFPHLITAIELCQINPSSTTETVHSILQNLLEKCSFITTDTHRWNEITEADAHLNFENIPSKSKLISVLRKEYFLDILIALTILSTTEHHGNSSRLYESEMFNQLNFLLLTFDHQQYLYLRPCENLHQIIQHCRLRSYLPPEYIPPKSLTFRDTILSDHEWSEDDEDDDGFLDPEDDEEEEILINEPANKSPEIIRPSYQVNYFENLCQLKFFAKLFAPLIEAIVSIVKYHIDHQLQIFTLEEFDVHQSFSFPETSTLISNDTLSFVRRAYAYRLLELPNICDGNWICFQVIDENIYPLSMDKLVSLHHAFMKLFRCWM